MSDTSATPIPRSSKILKAIQDGNIPGTSGSPRKTGNDQLDKLATAMWAAEQGKEWYDKIKAHYTAKTTWHVTVEESDAAYPIMQDWLMERLPRSKQRNVLANTRTFYKDGSEVDDSDGIFSRALGRSGGRTSETKVIVSLAETHAQNIVVEGHKVNVRVAINRPDESLGDDGRPRKRVSMVKNGKMIFTCRSLEAQDAVLRMLNGMVGGVNKRTPMLWIADAWGSWRDQTAPVRKLDSVVLADGIKDDILSDIQKFLDDEKKYTELGIPWHRGYLFHGPAGTGKTSLIKALAAEMGLDLWYAALGDMKEDGGLIDLVAGVRPRGILLLEDVDSFGAARDREEKEEKDAGMGVSTSALLNALDGVVTPHGLITIMTTNHVKKLDPAILRSGRADRVIKLDLPGWDEVQQLWALFFPNEAPLGGKPKNFKKVKPSQATVSEIFKRFWDTPDKARQELMDLFDLAPVEATA